MGCPATRPQLDRENEVEVINLKSRGLFAFWGGLDSIHLALAELLINTNCITCGPEPVQCAPSAPAYRWIGVSILALQPFFQIRKKHIDSKEI